MKKSHRRDIRDLQHPIDLAGGNGVARHAAKRGFLGSCARTRPPPSLMGTRPLLPSAPFPDRITAMARDPYALPSEESSTSKGIRAP